MGCAAIAQRIAAQPTGGSTGARVCPIEKNALLMQITAKTDYALRALIEIAVAEGGPVTSPEIAETQRIPLKFLENTMRELTKARLISSERGAKGGYKLRRPAEQITLADIIRVTNGPLVAVRNELPEDLEFDGNAVPMRQVWLALRTSIRSVLESVTLDDIVRGDLSEELLALAADGAEPPRES